jgi:hypothetical protein
VTILHRVRTTAFAIFVALPAFASAQTSPGAMPSCKSGDAVVWENTSSHSKAYHSSGDPEYGKTKHGKYACESDAKAAGYHLAKGHSKGASPAPNAAPSPTASAKAHHHHHRTASPSPTATST